MLHLVIEGAYMTILKKIKYTFCILLFFLTGCSIYKAPSTYQSNFDYSEYIAYDCPHNSKVLNPKCQTDKSE